MLTRAQILHRIVAALILAASAPAQDAGRFTGTWQGDHDGHAYLVLTVAAGNPLQVKLVTAHINVGKTGEIDSVEGPVEHEEKVLESTIENGVLRLRTEQENGEVMRYEMRVTEDGSALLRLPDEPDRVKPFRLKRK